MLASAHGDGFGLRGDDAELREIISADDGERVDVELVLVENFDEVRQPVLPQHRSDRRVALLDSLERERPHLDYLIGLAHEARIRRAQAFLIYCKTDRLPRSAPAFGWQGPQCARSRCL